MQNITSSDAIDLVDVSKLNITGVIFPVSRSSNQYYEKKYINSDYNSQWSKSLTVPIYFKRKIYLDRIIGKVSDNLSVYGRNLEVLLSSRIQDEICELLENVCQGELKNKFHSADISSHSKLIKSSLTYNLANEHSLSNGVMEQIDKLLNSFVVSSMKQELIREADGDLELHVRCFGSSNLIRHLIKTTDKYEHIHFIEVFDFPVSNKVVITLQVYDKVNKTYPYHYFNFANVIIGGIYSNATSLGGNVIYSPSYVVDVGTPIANVIDINL